MSHLSTAVCSVTRTQRRRFFWAAWWTGSPEYAPFRRPDASNGGANTLEEALADAERSAGRHLTLVEPYWARAWSRVLRGEAPPPPPRRPEARAQPLPSATDQAASAWSILGLESGASLAEVKRAFRKRALETHPDHGGEPAQFRAAQAAYEKLVKKLGDAPRPRRKR